MDYIYRWNLYLNRVIASRRDGFSHNNHLERAPLVVGSFQSSRDLCRRRYACRRVGSWCWVKSW